MNVCPGQRVEVPLGTRRARGVVLEPVRKPPAGVAMRDVLRVLDAEPLLTPELIVLGTWIADYYLAPPGEVFRAMLPLRAETRRARVVTLSEAGTERLKELEGSLLDEARASAEYQILDDLRSRGPTPLEQLQKRFDASRAALDQLLAQGWIAVSQTERARAARPAFAVRLASGLLPEFGGRKLSPVAKRILEALAKESFEDHRDLLETARAQFPYLRRLRDAGLVELRESAGRQADFSGAWPAARGAPPELTPAQSAVLNDLRERFDSGRFGVTLLHGVTASGKTEIYLRLIAHALERGRSALMLVPEIGLTPAVEAQFRARFREGVGVLHSGLSESRRHAAWWRVRRGEAHVVLGTRSAIFAPLANLGVVIVDEEHDPSYKQ